MVDGLRDAHEIIDLMVLVGGHPERYRDVLAKRFPAIPVFVMPDSMAANVRGFQMIGEAEVGDRAARRLIGGRAERRIMAVLHLELDIDSEVHPELHAMLVDRQQPCLGRSGFVNWLRPV